MLVWHDSAWEEYLDWLRTDAKAVRRINQLLKEVQRTPFEGSGKPEPLKGNLSGYWSRRIDGRHRLVYRVQDGDCVILQCKGHYGD